MLNRLQNRIWLPYWLVADERGWPFFILGRGSNLLVRDRGFRGVVICLAQAHFSRIEAEGRAPQLRGGRET